VFQWDKWHEKPGAHQKCDMLWLGPFMIEAIVGPNTFYLSHLDGEMIELLVNGQYLNPYYY
jgi:hypothetical protein